MILNSSPNRGTGVSVLLQILPSLILNLLMVTGSNSVSVILVGFLCVHI